MTEERGEAWVVNYVKGDRIFKIETPTLNVIFKMRKVYQMFCGLALFGASYFSLFLSGTMKQIKTPSQLCNRNREQTTQVLDKALLKIIATSYL